MTAVERPVARMILVLSALSVLSVIGSIQRGDDLRTTVTYVLVGLVCGGFVFLCYIWARRKR